MPNSVGESVAKLEGAIVERIEYYYLPEDRMTSSALTREKLISTAPYKVITSLPPRPLLVEIAKALQQSSYSPGANSADYRLGMIVYGEGSKQLLTVFFDQSGKQAVINNANFIVDGDLRMTILRRVRCIAE